MQDALLAMFVLNRGRLVGHLYLGSTLADARESVGQTTLPTMWDTGGIVKCCVLRSVSSGGFLQDSVLEGTSFQDKCDLFVAA